MRGPMDETEEAAATRVTSFRRCEDEEKRLGFMI